MAGASGALPLAVAAEDCADRIVGTAISNRQGLQPNASWTQISRGLARKLVFSGAEDHPNGRCRSAPFRPRDVVSGAEEPLPEKGRLEAAARRRLGSAPIFGPSSPPVLPPFGEFALPRRPDVLDVRKDPGAGMPTSGRGTSGCRQPPGEDSLPQQTRPKPSVILVGDSLARALLAVSRLERAVSRLEERVQADAHRGDPRSNGA